MQVLAGSDFNPDSSISSLIKAKKAKRKAEARVWNLEHKAYQLGDVYPQRLVIISFPLVV